MEELEINKREWGIILISAIISVLLAKYLPVEPFTISKIETIDIILTALIIGILILIPVSIIINIFNWLDKLISKVFPDD